MVAEGKITLPGAKEPSAGMFSRLPGGDYGTMGGSKGSSPVR